MAVSGTHCFIDVKCQSPLSIKEEEEEEEEEEDRFSCMRMHVRLWVIIDKNWGGFG